MQLTTFPRPKVMMAEGHRPAYWTFDALADRRHGERMYYFAPIDRSPPPYKEQRHVQAIIDIAADGTLAGVELIDNMPLPPTSLPNMEG